MMKTYDTVVIGGGPAGASAAIHLANKGARVLLLEASDSPRHKLCGEFLSPECTQMLAELGALEAIENCKPPRIGWLRMTSSRGSAWEAALPGKALGISRWTLDKILLEQANISGVEVRLGGRAIGLNGNLDKGFRVKISRERDDVKARTVISAHGKRSNIDRDLGRIFFKKKAGFMAFKAHFKDISLPGWVELHGFEGGYCGVSNIEAGLANVCFLVKQDFFQRIIRSNENPVNTFLSWMLEQNAQLRERLSKGSSVWAKWISIAQISFERKTPVEGEILMAGDAAGLIAPLAGDGIAMALQSGEIGARMISRYLAGELDGRSMPAAYARAWEAAFRNRLRLAHLLQGVMLNPGLQDGVLRLVRRFPAVGDVLVRKTRGA